MAFERVLIKNDIYWDNWGKMVKAFRHDETLIVEVHDDGKASAESTIYAGVIDFIYPEDFCVITNEDEWHTLNR